MIEEVSFSGLSKNSYRRLRPELDIFIVKDTGGKCLIKICFPSDIRLPIDRISLKGVDVYSQKLDGENNILMMLKNDGDADIFMRFCDDLVYTPKSKSAQKYADSIMNRIYQWMEFLSKDRQTEIPIRKQLGLLGELLFIKKLTANGLSFEEVLSAWGGPDMAPKDFSFPKIDVEVKSCLDEENTVRISSENQLSNGVKPLYLSVFKLFEDSEGFNLADIVQELVTKAINELNSLRGIFERKLLAADYNCGMIYSNLISVSEAQQIIYSVEEGFPCIKKKDLPDSVAAVKYNLDLNYCAKYITNISNEILVKGM